MKICAVCITILWFLANTSALPQSAPPTIAQGGVVNLASRMPTRLNGGAIAPGSLISIRGWRFTPAGPESRAPDASLAESLAGTSVRIKQGASEISAPLIAVSANEIQALIPPSLAPGDVEMRVSRNGQISRTPARLRLMDSGFGIFSRNRKGWGPGDIENSDGQPNAPERAAKPGELLALRGTGLGPATAQASVQVIVGNQVADAARIARASSGARITQGDEVAFAVPQGAPEGCYVPLRVRIGDRVSNTVTLAVSPSGGACNPADDASFASHLSEPGRFALVALARVALRIALTPRKKVDYLMDTGYARFELGTPGETSNPYRLLPVAGTCTTLADQMMLSSVIKPASIILRSGGTRLDAGSTMTLQGPHGQRQFPVADGGLIGGNTPLPRPESKRFPSFLSPGEYSASAPGGHDIPPFETQVQVTEPIRWMNRDELETVDRERGVTVKWHAAKPDSLILITALNSDQQSDNVGVCLCVQRASAEEFHVPPDALANIPPTPADAQGLPTNLLLLAELPSDNTTHPAGSSGLDRVTAVFVSVSGKTVSFR